jgi:hypothetical protein
LSKAHDSSWAPSPAGKQAGATVGEMIARSCACKISDQVRAVFGEHREIKTL